MSKSQIPVIQSMPDNISVHRAPEHGMRPVHRNSGMWIFRWSSHGSSSGPTTILRPWERPRYFEFFCISHMFKGNGYYWQSGHEVEEVSAGQCILVSPGAIHCYGPMPGKTYQEDTINFSGPLAEMLFKSGVFTDGKFECGSFRALLEIVKYLSDPSDHSQLNAVFQLQQFLYELYNKRFRKHGQERYPEIDELVKMLREQPDRWWNIDEMAEYCNMSDDQFRRVFRQRVGMLPKVYIDRLKMNQAAAMLTNGNLKIAEIAEVLGYTDQFHFSRRFRKIIGLSPGEYRRDAITHK